ncbi:hypothetical protein ACVWXO_000379 [Bradyrhizobium sp. LM2.7]
MSSTMAAAVRKMRSSTGDAGAHHGNQGNRECGVGRHRNAPPVRPCPRRDDQRIQKRRHDHAAERGRDRKRRGAAACEMTDRHLALHFQSHDEEEHRQHAVVDPMEDGHLKGCAAQAHAELLAPERLERRPDRRVRHDDRRRGREDKQNAGGRAPAREVQGCRTDAVAERAKHRVDERALVPGTIVAPAVDVEGRRESHAACAGACEIRLHPRPRAPDRVAIAELKVGVHAEVGGHRDEVVLCELHRPRHQLDVRRPERLGRLGKLSELGGPKRKAVVRERPVPEGVADTVAKLVACLRDTLVGGPAVRARVAAVLDERDLGIGGAEHVVRLVVDRTVEADGRDHELHR